MRRFHGLVCIFALSAALLTACGGDGSEPSSDGTIKIRLANVEQNGTYMPVIAAKELGFFEDEDLDVTYNEAVTPVQDKAMIGGQLDFGTLNSGQVLAANSVGDLFVMVATLSNVPVMSMFGQPEIKTIEDLKGKTIAVGSVGTASDIVAHILLEEHDMLDEVTLQPIAGGGPSVLAALQKGLVDGAVFAPPNTSMAAAEGYNVVVDPYDLDIDWVQSGIVTTQRFAEENPEAVRRVAAAVTKGWQFIADPANEERVLEMLAESGTTTPDIDKATYDYMIRIWSTQDIPTVALEGMETAIKFSPEAQEEELKAEDQFDNSFLPKE